MPRRRLGSVSSGEASDSGSESSSSSSSSSSSESESEDESSDSASDSDDEQQRKRKRGQYCYRSLQFYELFSCLPNYAKFSIDSHFADFIAFQFSIFRLLSC